MISLAENADFTDRLSETYYGMKIRSYLDAYGVGYDFCRFYVGSGESDGVLLCFNGSAVCDGSISNEDLCSFLGFCRPHNLEISGEERSLLKYKAVKRVMFGFTVPVDFIAEEIKSDDNLDSHFRIIKSGFPEIDYEKWLVDISHRKRHGVSKLFKFEEIASATMQFCFDNFAFFSEIAVLPECRGQGAARRMLYSIAAEFAKKGISCGLFALPHRVGFYREIGFREIFEDNIYYSIGDS